MIFAIKTAVWYLCASLPKQRLCGRCYECQQSHSFDSYHKERADNCDFTHNYRLCVFASGSLITDKLNCRIAIIVSCLHFGQYSGKFSSTVSSRIFNRVLFAQVGHNTHSTLSIPSPLLSADSSFIHIHGKYIGYHYQPKTPSLPGCVANTANR